MKKENHSSKNTNNRNVFIFGRLENEIALPIIKRLLKLSDQDSKTPIDVYINSSGGNGYNADAVIAVINAISSPVNTICLGHALSGACEILAAGTGVRKAYEFATIMFHQTLWEADGDITNLEIQAKQGQKFRQSQIELLHRCTGRERKEIRDDIERDFYLSAQEALDYGVIDEIISHRMPESRKKLASKTRLATTLSTSKIHRPKAASGKAGKEMTSTHDKQFHSKSKR